MADMETARCGGGRLGEPSAQEGDSEYQDFLHLLVFSMVFGAGGFDAAVARRIRKFFQQISQECVELETAVVGFPNSLENYNE
jgi:hypothetical protein